MDELYCWQVSWANGDLLYSSIEEAAAMYHRRLNFGTEAEYSEVEKTVAELRKEDRLEILGVCVKLRRIW